MRNDRTVLYGVHAAFPGDAYWRLGRYEVVAAILFFFCCTAALADAFQRLTGAQIRTQFTGKVLTDGTHWRETYTAGGKLSIEEMGRGASTGSWRIEGDRLCKVRPNIMKDCYEVWASGNSIELRGSEWPPLEAFLRGPSMKQLAA